MLICTQVEVPILLPPYRRDSVRSSQVPGFRVPIKMDSSKHEARLASALFTEDHLQTCKKGELSLGYTPSYGCIFNPVHSSRGKIG